MVTGTLGLTTGDLTTPGAFTVSQPTSAPASTGTGDVVGTVIRTGAFTGGTAYTFGNPFNQISVSGGVLPTPISVRLVKTAPAAKANAVTRTYTITPTGGSAYSATVQLRYLDTEINGNTEANLVLWHLNGSWSSAGVNSLDNSNNWVQQTGIAAGATLTGDWAIGNAVGSATQVRVETAADGSGTIVPAQSLASGSSLTAYAISRDSIGNFVANVSATWSMTSTTGDVATSDLSTTSGPSTVFTGHLTGTGTIHADAGGGLTGDSGVITVTPGAIDHFVVSAPGATVAGVPLGSVTVTAQDVLNQTVTGYAGTITFTSTDAQAVLPAPYTFVPGTDAGVHTFSTVNLKTAGNQTVTVSGSTKTGVSGTIVVSAAAASKLAVTTINPASPVAGSPGFSVTVVSQDPFGNLSPVVADTAFALTPGRPARAPSAAA